MRKLCRIALALLTTASLAFAGDEGLNFVPLFNGKDLTGWRPVNVAPSTFTVKDGVIHSTGVPTGYMRTGRQYENFVIELEWMHEKPKGNAGLFLWGAPLPAVGSPFARGIEVQILDDAFVSPDIRHKGLYTGHGDVFAIQGATMKPDRPHPSGWQRCLPSEHRAKPAGQWNHYRVEARDGVVTLAVNGKVVSGGSQCVPRKGYLCLESEGSPAQFKNIRIAELPSGNPRPEECAPLDEGFTLLYAGVDLSGWVQDPGHKGHWQADNWNLKYDGKSEAADKTLWTEKEFGDFVLTADWRYPVERNDRNASEDWRGAILLRGNEDDRIELGPSPLTKRPGHWNRVVITAKGKVVKVELNGETLFDAAPVPGKATRGRIGLQSKDNPIEFGNLFIRELE